MREVLRGQIWWFYPDPTKGREQVKKIRPCVIISDTKFNIGPAGLVIVIPCTTTQRGIPCHIPLSTRKDGPKKKCFAMCEQIRAIDKLRLKKQMGTVTKNEMTNIEGWICDLLNLSLDCLF